MQLTLVITFCMYLYTAPGGRSVEIMPTGTWCETGCQHWVQRTSNVDDSL